MSALRKWSNMRAPPEFTLLMIVKSGNGTLALALFTKR
jgi:hypothetical protein